MEVDGTHLHTFSRCVTLNAEVAFVVSFAAKKVATKRKPQTRPESRRSEQPPLEDRDILADQLEELMKADEGITNHNVYDLLTEELAQEFAK